MIEESEKHDWQYSIEAILIIWKFPNLVNCFFGNKEERRREVEKLYGVYARLRDAKGMKDIEVARGSGVEPDTLSAWKTGKSIPKMDKLVKIADFFGVSIEEFAKVLR
jgi:DNA-binding XRE family transcriptional regulator